MRDFFRMSRALYDDNVFPGIPWAIHALIVDKMADILTEIPLAAANRPNVRQSSDCTAMILRGVRRGLGRRRFGTFPRHAAGTGGGGQTYCNMSIVAGLWLALSAKSRGRGVD